MNIYESEETEVKKDKQWLKEEVNEIKKLISDAWGAAIIAGNRHFEVKNSSEMQIVKRISDLINQLDEPEVLSQEWIDEHKENWQDLSVTGYSVPEKDLQNLLVPKQELPVIPKFVAEWIEFKKKSGIPYENVFQAINELVNSHTSKAHNWVLKTDENKDAFARAWLDGYEVEEEQKYYVLDKENATLLKKSSVGEGVAKSVGTNIYNTKSWKNEEEYQLAEQEIKDYDERYWPFAVKVEELEK